MHGRVSVTFRFLCCVLICAARSHSHPPPPPFHYKPFCPARSTLPLPPSTRFLSLSSFRSRLCIRFFSNFFSSFVWSHDRFAFACIICREEVVCSCSQIYVHWHSLSLSLFPSVSLCFYLFQFCMLGVCVSDRFRWIFFFHWHSPFRFSFEATLSCDGLAVWRCPTFT